MEALELTSLPTALVPGSGRPRTGRLAVYGDVLAFYDEETGEDPLLVIPRTTIYAVTCERKLLNRDRMRIRTVGGDFLFSAGYRAVRALLNGRA